MKNNDKKPLIKKPSTFYYGILRTASKFMCKFVYNSKVIKNELTGTKGRRVIIANHEAGIDFMTLAAAIKEKTHFVISNSFYRSLSINGVLKACAVIPKNQFQTVITDMKLMKAAVDSGRPLVLYPAGLMPENGIATPVPAATGKTLKWLDADVYFAKVSGSYLTSPKWSKVKRKGKITMSITKLISREDLKELSNDQTQKLIEDSLYFNAYKNNETALVEYKNGDNVEGLENVLFKCPECNKEYGLQPVGKKKNVLACDCGFTLTADKYGFLTASNGKPEYKLPCDIYERIEKDLEKEILTTPDFSMNMQADIHMINDKKHKYEIVGEAKLTLDKENLSINGTLKGQPFYKQIFAGFFPTLPFVPGKRFELQADNEIYRIVPKDARAVTKWVNALKIIFKYHKGINNGADTAPSL